MEKNPSDVPNDRKATPEQEPQMDQQTHLATARTDLALERTILANERTVSAWLRTGLTAIAAGLGIAKLLVTVEPSWMTQMTASVLVIMGSISFIVAFWRYWEGYQRLKRKNVEFLPVGIVGILVVGLFIGSLFAFILLW